MGLFLPKNNRAMSSNWFKRKLANGEELTRFWLMHLPSKKAAYCICSLLYCRSDHQSSLQQKAGFSQWKAPERMIVHENAKHRRECSKTWKELERNLSNKTGIINTEFQVQIENEKQKWHQILKRILHGIKYLAEQNLALRGHRESLQADSDLNVGNFLGLMKFLAVFDSVLREHLGFIKSHPLSTSYLSSGVQNEFIHLVGSHVCKNLTEKIKKAKYCSLIFDSTPDQAHREQVLEVVRYVDIDIDKKTVCVKESFLGFFQIYQNDGGSFVEVIMQQLQKNEVKIKNCRSQCYMAMLLGWRDMEWCTAKNIRKKQTGSFC